MSDNLPKEIETDYQKIIAKISKEKEERHKGLEELFKRKRELERHREEENYSHRERGDEIKKPRQTVSSDRYEYNQKVYEHLLSPKPKESKIVKSPKVTYHSRFEEETAHRQMEAAEAQKNRLKMIDKRARYAGIVKEIFSPAINLQKRLEVENRINQDNIKSRTGFNQRGNSAERETKKTLQPEKLYSSNSQTNLKKSESEWGPKIILNAGKITLETGNKIY